MGAYAIAKMFFGYHLLTGGSAVLPEFEDFAERWGMDVWNYEFQGEVDAAALNAKWDVIVAGDAERDDGDTLFLYHRDSLISSCYEAIPVPSLPPATGPLGWHGHLREGFDALGIDHRSVSVNPSWWLTSFYG